MPKLSRKATRNAGIVVALLGLVLTHDLFASRANKLSYILFGQGIVVILVTFLGPLFLVLGFLLLTDSRRVATVPNSSEVPQRSLWLGPLLMVIPALLLKVDGFLFVMAFAVLGLPGLVLFVLAVWQRLAARLQRRK